MLNSIFAETVFEVEEGAPLKASFTIAVACINPLLDSVRVDK